MFGSPWPADLPVQIHGMDADPLFVDEGDIEAAHEIVASSHLGQLFLYPGDQHYFADKQFAVVRRWRDGVAAGTCDFLRQLDG